jgi:hypothetical protein
MNVAILGAGAIALGSAALIEAGGPSGRGVVAVRARHGGNSSATARWTTRAW